MASNKRRSLDFILPYRSNRRRRRTAAVATASSHTGIRARAK